MKISQIKKYSWDNIWAGRWCLLTCSYLGDQLTKDMRFQGQCFSKLIITVSEGRSSCWAIGEDKDRFGRYLARQVKRNPKFVKQICSKVKREVDIMLDYIDTHEGKVLTLEKYQGFWKRVSKYYYNHVPIKYTIDYLDAKTLAQYLPQFQKARLYAESVFDRVEDLSLSFIKLVAKKEKLPATLVSSVTGKEMESYLAGGKLPGVRVLNPRYKEAVLYFDSKRQELISGESVRLVHRLLSAQKISGLIKGVPAYPGKVQGVVRVVPDPRGVKIFNLGDILITGMTRPEYLPLMKKAGAFVTDAGGMLSHAAITARELKKPCIVGTKSASKVFKDGDRVEVDANRGIVKKLK